MCSQPVLQNSSYRVITFQFFIIVSVIVLVTIFLRLQDKFFPLSLFQEGQLSVTGESMCTKYWLTA